MHLSKEGIETARLKIKLVDESFAEEIFRELTDDVTKYLRVPRPKKIEEEEKWIIESKKDYLTGEKMNLVAVDLSNQFIGCCGLTDLKSKVPELGLRLKESARGKGYGTEIVKALINWAEKNKEFDYILYKAHIDNMGTRKIAEKMGAILQMDEQGKEKIFMANKFDNSASFREVEYRIYNTKK